MRALIIEDEPAAARRLKTMLHTLDKDIAIMDVIDSVEDAVAFLTSQPEPDLIFADIQLSDGVCFDIFKQVMPNSAVIFTTAYDEYAMEAFKVNSVDYLLKPVDPDELKKSLDKFKNLKLAFAGKDTAQTANTEKLAALVALLDNQDKKYKSRFLVKSGNSFKPVGAADIAYFLIENQLVFLYDRTGKRYLVESTLDEIESTVDPATFFRINRQMIVSLPSVKAIHPYFNSRLKLDLNPELKDEEVIVSRLKAGDFKKWLEE